MTEAPPCCPFCFYSRRLQKYWYWLTKNTKGTQATQSKDKVGKFAKKLRDRVGGEYTRQFHFFLTTGINWVDNCALATLKRFENWRFER